MNGGGKLFIFITALLAVARELAKFGNMLQRVFNVERDYGHLSIPCGV